MLSNRKIRWKCIESRERRPSGKQSVEDKTFPVKNSVGSAHNTVLPLQYRQCRNARGCGWRPLGFCDVRQTYSTDAPLPACREMKALCSVVKHWRGLASTSAGHLRLSWPSLQTRRALPLCQSDQPSAVPPVGAARPAPNAGQGGRHLSCMKTAERERRRQDRLADRHPQSPAPTLRQIVRSRSIAALGRGPTAPPSINRGSIDVMRERVVIGTRARAKLRARQPRRDAKPRTGDRLREQITSTLACTRRSGQADRPAHRLGSMMGQEPRAGRLHERIGPLEAACPEVGDNLDLAHKRALSCSASAEMAEQA